MISVEIRKLQKIFRSDAVANLKAYHILLLNLAVADLLMGFYLLILGIVGVVYRDNYCIHSLRWESSLTCQILGALAVISSETSILTIVTITSFRVYAVFKVNENYRITTAIIMERI